MITERHKMLDKLALSFELFELQRQLSSIVNVKERLFNKLNEFIEHLYNSDGPLKEVFTKMLSPSDDGSYGTLRTYYEEAVEHEMELLDECTKYMMDMYMEFWDIISKLNRKIDEIQEKIDAIKAQMAALD